VSQASAALPQSAEVVQLIVHQVSLGTAPVAWLSLHRPLQNVGEASAPMLHAVGAPLLVLVLVLEVDVELVLEVDVELVLEVDVELVLLVPPPPPPPPPSPPELVLLVEPPDELLGPPPAPEDVELDDPVVVLVVPAPAPPEPELHAAICATAKRLPAAATHPRCRIVLIRGSLRGRGWSSPGSTEPGPTRSIKRRGPISQVAWRSYFFSARGCAASHCSA
jgi:hypothetical protein